MRITGRGLSEGKVEGTVIKSSMPLSLVDDVNLLTSEILDKGNEIHREPIKDKVLIFPYAKESKSYPDTIRKLKDRNVQPKALVAENLEEPLVADAVNSKVPAIDRVDISLFETKDEVTVNGTDGALGLKSVTLRNIATSVLTSKGKVIILKRSQDVGTYKGRWACVSGYVEKGENSFETAVREIWEELGLKREDCELLRKGEVLYARDKETMWAIHPFLFKVKRIKLKLDWEHEKYKWIFLEDIENYTTVPKLKETIKSVLITANE